MAQDKEWSEEDELDPLKMQREGIDALNKVIKLREEEVAKEGAEVQRPTVSPPIEDLEPERLVAFSAPTFSETSKRLQRAWKETKAIAPDAPPEVQARIFHDLNMARSDQDESVDKQVIHRCSIL